MSGNASCTPTGARYRGPSSIRPTPQQADKRVKILFAVPQDLYPTVTYPLALTAAGSKKAEAVAFHKYLQSAEARKIIAKYGFAVK